MDENLYYANMYENANGRTKKATKRHKIVKVAQTLGIPAVIGLAGFGAPLTVAAAVVVGAANIADSRAYLKLKAWSQKQKLSKICREYNSILNTIMVQNSNKGPNFPLYKLFKCRPTDTVRLEVRYPDSPASKMFGINPYADKYINCKNEKFADRDNLIKFCFYVYHEGQEEPYNCYEVSEIDDDNPRTICCNQITDTLNIDSGNQPEMYKQFDLKEKIDKAFNNDLYRTRVNSKTGARSFNDVSINNLKTVFDYFGGYSYYLDDKFDDVAFGHDEKKKIEHFKKLAGKYNIDLLPEERNVIEGAPVEREQSLGFDEPDLTQQPPAQQQQTQPAQQQNQQQPVQQQTQQQPVQQQTQQQPVQQQTQQQPVRQPQRAQQQPKSNYSHDKAVTMMKEIYDNFDQLNDAEIMSKYNINKTTLASLKKYVIDHMDELSQRFDTQSNDRTRQGQV